MPNNLNKVAICFVLCLSLSILIVGWKTSAEENNATAEPLAPLAAAALKEGKDTTMNAGFAAYLGIAKSQTGISMKRIVADAPGGTNIFNVSISDKRTVVLVTRRKSLATYFLTDLSGKLKRAVVNDSSIEVGGITNIPIASAQSDFEKQKNWWIAKYVKNGAPGQPSK